MVYETTRTTELENFLRNERAVAKPGRGKNKNPRPSSKIRSQLLAHAQGLFCLKQLWSTTETSDYTLLPLMDEPVILGANDYWKLTANRNHVAATLAMQFGKRGMKTLVFAQNKQHAMSIANEIAAILPATIGLDSDEVRWRDIAIEELGGEDYILGLTGGQAGVHHGLLISAERYLVESVFRRDANLSILVGTPTLAQGMNLPAQVVILAGDDRFDAAASRSEQLKAHELLNAVGRAGRAGHSAEGVVLLVPGVVVGINQTQSKITKRWLELQENIFSKADQCLDIEDPVGVMLDVIQDAATNRDARDQNAIEYFVNRLPQETEVGQRLLNRSLAAFHAKRRNAMTGFEQRVTAALTLRKTYHPTVEDTTSSGLWIHELATATGLPSWLVLDVATAVDSLKTTAEDFDLTRYVKWFFEWLEKDPRRALPLFRNDIFVDALPSWNSEGTGPSTLELRLVRTLVDMWIQGEPLLSLQRLLRPERKPGKCMEARVFALQCIPDIGYAIGLNALVLRNRVDAGSANSIPVVVAVAAACIREGVDSPEKLSFRFEGEQRSRICISREFEALRSHVLEGRPDEDFSQTTVRVRTAIRKQRSQLPF